MELMVAIGIFLVIGGAAFTLARQHIPLFSSQQNQAGLNFSLRNAVAQMQIDVVNAGSGFYTAADVPGWPIGLTIINNPAGATDCHNSVTNTYGPTCFDTLNVISTDKNTAPSHPSDSTGKTSVDTSTNTILYLTPVAPTTPAALAANLKNGDQILLLTDDGSHMTTTKLTADAVVSGTMVKITHALIGADGTNSAANDPLGISTSAESRVLLKPPVFDPNDWVLKLAPITYDVDATDPTNPKLRRRQTGIDCNTDPAKCVIAEQVIGFKIGASLWNGTTDSTYDYDASHYSKDFTKIRAVRITLIGRTPPAPASDFRNKFDQGPYKIEATSVVINPRNLSMKDR
jgi:hypothetical protein